MSKYIPSKDLDQLSIQKLSFHLIEKEAQSPSFLEELVVEEQQYLFFENVIRLASSKSTEYSFLEEENDSVLLMIEVLEESEEQFEEYTRKLSNRFWNEHQGNTSDGILLYALVTIGEENHKMLFLAKMDYQQVLSVVAQPSENGETKTILTEIKRALVESENAIQKSALIDIDSIYEWDILAQDRLKSGGGLADYFKRFLHVEEKEINAILSTQVVAEVQKWATKNSEEVLLPTEHLADYKERAVSYLRAASEFDTHELMNIVIPEDDNLERKQELQQSLYEHLEKKELTDRIFAPEPEGISASVTKNSIKTAENVTISWEGDMANHGIELKEVDGKMQIIISTEDYTFK